MDPKRIGCYSMDGWNGQASCSENSNGPSGPWKAGNLLISLATLSSLRFPLHLLKKTSKNLNVKNVFINGSSEKRTNECDVRFIHPTWLPLNTDDNVFGKDCIVPTASPIIQYLKEKLQVFSAVTVLWLLVDWYKYAHFSEEPVVYTLKVEAECCSET